MSSENELYFEAYVLPHISQTVKRQESAETATAPPTSSSSSSTSSSATPLPAVSLSDEKSAWARRLNAWLLQNNKKMQIRIVQVHHKFLIAVVSILYREEGEYFELIQSLCVSLTAQGFEACYKDLYLNSNIGGTAQENTDGKSAYTLSANIIVQDRFLLSTGHPARHEKTWSPFCGTISKFRTLSECAEYVNRLTRNSANTSFIISDRLDGGGTGEYCSSLQVYDMETMRLHSTVFPQHTYRVSSAADTTGQCEKMESIPEK